jgi:hypothetical protein
MSAVSLCAAARSVNSKPEGRFRIGCAGGRRGPALGLHQIRGNLDAGSSIVAMIGAMIGAITS